MKKFIKENWFKIVIAICAIFIVILYGLSKYNVWEKQDAERLLIEQRQQKKELEQKERCNNIGSEAHIKLTNELKGNKAFMFEPIYHFNSKLNTCLYSGGWIEGEFINKFIKDVYKNEDIILYIESEGESLHTSEYCGEECVSSEEFENRSEILFNE